MTIILSREDILEILPYGEAFCFLEKVNDIQSCKSIRASMTYDLSSPIVGAHFKDGPHVVPAVILIEQACQAALLLGLKSNLIPAADRGYIGRLKASFQSPAIPKCKVDVSVRFERVIGNSVAFSARSRVDNVVVANIQAVSTVITPAQE